MSNMLPAPDVLNKMEGGKFVLAILAAKRANQVREGAPPLVSVESPHPLTISLAEIAAGKIKPIVPTIAEVREAGELVYAKITEEPLPAELGMLLPALDETEVVLIESEIHTEEEHDVEAPAAPAAEGMTLSDLVTEEEADEPEAAPVVGEDETLSLTDIAEQETTLEEEEEHEG